MMLNTERPLHTVSGSDMSGYHVIETVTGTLVAGPFPNRRDAFAALPSGARV